MVKLSQISDAPTARINTNPVVKTHVGAWTCSECRHLNTVAVRECQECGKRRPGHIGEASRSHDGHSEIPNGVRQAASLERLAEAPSKQFSLWAHYSHRIQAAARARDIGMLLKLAACATRDYELHTGKRKPSQHSSHEQQVEELLRDYSGCPSVECAWMLNTSEKWVRRQRVLNGRDPDYGHERDGDELTMRILRLHARGMSERAISDEVGLSKTAVHHRLTVTAVQEAA